MPNSLKRRPLVGTLLGTLGALALIHCSQAPNSGETAGLGQQGCNPACGPGEVCSAARHCEPAASGGASAGGTGSGGSSSGGASANGGSAGTVVLMVPDASTTDVIEVADGDACADVEFEVTNVVPSVVLLIDRSASMSDEDLDPNDPGVTRWDALKTALLDPAGAIGALQDQVRFGVVFYAGGSRNSTCPVLDEGGDPATLMPPRTGLLADFTTYFQALGTLPDTPTGESVAFTAGELTAFTETGPKFIVLATDGEPDLCDDRQEPSGRDLSLAEVTAAFASGITTFVISVGTDVALTHLTELANAGQGFPTTDMPATPRYYQVTTQQALTAAFEEIITGTRSCTLSLNGEIDPRLAERGEVLLDGMPVPKSDTDGWKVVDGSTIELVGSACEAIQEGVHSLSASFPCEVIIKPPH
ncbi:MAG TPA: vWA domain-containing protein [Polyangiaceae bacterium]|nr:vWA domain-containing protein [Polyangiaceae bacterium]